MTTAGRTQQAIIDAAIRLWATDARASLGDVATAAGVGRTTVHRSFPDRAALIAAVDDQMRRRFGEAVRRARIGEGSATAAVERLATQLLDLGEPLRLVFADAAVVDPARWREGEASHTLLTDLFGRGITDGEFDRHQDPEWMVLTMWLLLYGAWLLYDQEQISLRDAHWLTLRSLRGAISGPTGEDGDQAG